ncbi:MAG: hypothetical protein WC955_10395 [Elusimicrobiota bacterium]
MRTYSISIARSVSYLLTTKNSLSLWDNKLTTKMKLVAAECFVVPDRKNEIVSRFDDGQRDKINKLGCQPHKIAERNRVGLGV